MCIDKILSLFKKKNIAAPSAKPEPVAELTPGRLSIPYPEEPPDYSKTIDNTDLDSALDMWEIVYNVPEIYREFWETKIAIKLDANLPYPAGTYTLDGIRHLTIRPEWVNPGVIAHEQAHNSYALLSEEQKSEFSREYTPLKTTDPLIVLLYSKNSYGLTNDIEGHAEVYRYLGEKMPEVLKKYYPKLFD
jgi:hypothetical protein